LRAAGDERQARRLASYLAYDAQIFAQLDPKLKSSVAFQVAQVLSPFAQPELVDAFCTAGAGPAMEAVLNGRVYLVRLPTAQYGMGAKVALTLVKLRLFNVLQRRRSEPSWNQDRPVFFLCDEYQEIISAARDALSDLTFWDKSRSSGCLGIVSAQAVSSFYAALGGNEHLANTVLQNFRQRIVFRTEDPGDDRGRRQTLRERRGGARQREPRPIAQRVRVDLDAERRQFAVVAPPAGRGIRSSSAASRPTRRSRCSRSGASRTTTCWRCLRSTSTSAAGCSEHRAFVDSWPLGRVRAPPMASHSSGGRNGAPGRRTTPFRPSSDHSSPFQ